MYQMQLVAGEQGINNDVSWVHILEEQDVCRYLEGNELVFTCGLKCDSSEWLRQYIENLIQVGASALVVNTGQDIRSIPPDILAYCDEKGFPLFTIPWETRMVDMTKDFCQRILRNEEKEQHEATAMKNILFGAGDLEEDVATLERYGYPAQGKYMFLVLAYEEGDRREAERERLKGFVERSARFVKDAFLSFTYDGYRILALVDYTPREQSELLHRLSRSEEAKHWKLRIGVGSQSGGLEHQRENFQNALSALDLAKRLHKKIIYYEDLGIYKLLTEIRDTQKLEEYYKATIGKLAEYDTEHQTQLAEILHTYLLSNGSPNVTAEKLYLHRNTVNNQLKKVEKITGLNPLELEDKLKLYLGFYIQNII